MKTSKEVQQILKMATAMRDRQIEESDDIVNKAEAVKLVEAAKHLLFVAHHSLLDIK